MLLTRDLVLALLAAEFAVEATATLLNLGRLGPRLPEDARREFGALYDEKRYARSQAYLRETARFGLAARLARLAAMFAFFLLGGLVAVDTWARSLGFGTVATGLAFAAALGLLRGALSLPFAAYATFGIESRHGFNRTTWGTFAGDLLKGTILGALVGAPALAGVLALFERAGELGWLWAWLAVSALQLTLAFVAPAVILPLFNRYEPLPAGAARDAVEAYARAQGFRLQGIFVMDGSRRSTKANAFFTGFGRFRRLVLFDTLVTKNTAEELTAVLAHEVGHFRLGHIPRSLALSLITGAALTWALFHVARDPGLQASFGLEPSAHAGLLLASLAFGPILRPFSLFTSWLSRRHEFEADRFSAATHGRPEALVSALKKLSADHLSHLTPHPFKVALDYSHPPVLERIRALRRES